MRRLVTGQNITRQQTVAILHTPIRQACDMMKRILVKADMLDTGKNFHLALSYVVLFYEFHLDGQKVMFTRPLRQRTLLNWSGGVHHSIQNLDPLTPWN